MQNVEKIKSYIENNLNILLQGKHGTGKTTVLTQAAEELGYTVAYYSASTMDPWADFVGIPVPTDMEDGTKTLVNIRPHRIDEAQVVIFDELNRADPKVLNAVLELVQFRSINGQVLPNLKCVIAAQNPPEEGYNVDTLDEALVDRFDIMINVEPDITIPYLAAAIGDKRVARHFVTWWRQRGQMSNKADYLSPRRLEKMASLYIQFNRDFDVVEAALPPGKHDIGKLRDMLNEPTDPASINSWYTKTADATAIRSRDPETLASEFPNLSNENRRKVVDALRNQIGPDVLYEKYASVIGALTDAEVGFLVDKWGPSKIYRARSTFSKLSDEEKQKMSAYEKKLNTL